MLQTILVSGAVVIGTGIITAALIATPFAADVKSFMAIVACYAVGMILARPNQQNIAVSMAIHERWECI
ncbi:MAG: hypothetical protein ACLSB9_29965 [Hydrogeniiclostridium mannosilyticum]